MIAKGALSDLEELQIEKSSNLSMATLDALIGGCKELRSVGDLSQWEGISGPDLGQMRQLAHEQNLQLDLSSHQVLNSKKFLGNTLLSSHQVLRRFLGLANGDQRAMMTLMTGPIMERIRLTQVSSSTIFFFQRNITVFQHFFINWKQTFFNQVAAARQQGPAA